MRRFKAVSIIALFLALLLVDNWCLGFFGYLFFYAIDLIFPDFLKAYLLSTGIVGKAFKTLVNVRANHPEIWESVSARIMSIPSKSKMLCPPGFFVAPNQSHFPTSNGCGADHLKIDINYLPYENQEQCCNAHDVCYDKCHAFSSTDMDEYRNQCDLEFKSCLGWICSLETWKQFFTCPFKNFLSGSLWEDHCELSLRDDRRKKCKASVEVLYEFVYSWGTGSYEKAQTQACICVPRDQYLYSKLSYYFLLFAFITSLVTVLWVVLRRSRLITDVQ